jgi:hypothetical protein
LADDLVGSQRRVRPRPEPITEGTAMTEAPGPAATILRLTPDEAALLRTALRMLIATLGRDEAEELAEVQALLAKLNAAIGGA